MVGVCRAHVGKCEMPAFFGRHVRRLPVTVGSLLKHRTAPYMVGHAHGRVLMIIFFRPLLFSLIHLKRYVGLAKWSSIIYLYRILFIFYLLVSSLNIWFFYVFLSNLIFILLIPIYFFNLFLLDFIVQFNP
jgi:hypothetical protein